MLITNSCREGQRKFAVTAMPAHLILLCRTGKRVFQRCKKPVPFLLHQVMLELVNDFLLKKNAKSAACHVSAHFSAAKTPTDSNFDIHHQACALAFW